jgi:hypothetical protein
MNQTHWCILRFTVYLLLACILQFLHHTERLIRHRIHTNILEKCEALASKTWIGLYIIQHLNIQTCDIHSLKTAIPAQSKFLQILIFNRLYHQKGTTIFICLFVIQETQNSLIQIQIVPWIRKSDCPVSQAANPLTHSITMTNIKQVYLSKLEHSYITEN